MVLDEPTSILTENEKQVLFGLIRVLRQQGVSVIYISHRLEEIYQIADRLTIIRDGRNVATLSAKDTAGDHMAIAELMLGEKMDHVYPDKGKYFRAPRARFKSTAMRSGFDQHVKPFKTAFFSFPVIAG